LARLTSENGTLRFWSSDLATRQKPHGSVV
jgi:hypothetical protein